MQPEPMKPQPQPVPTPQRLGPVPMPQEPKPQRSRVMLMVYGAAVVAALLVGGVVTGFVHLPGLDSGAPVTSVSQPVTSATQGGPQQSDEGDHTLAGRFATVSPQLVQARGLSRNDGVVVLEAFGNSPLEKGGVRQNDVITAIDGVPVRTYGELSSKIRFTPIGQQFIVTVDRAGAAESHAVTIERCVLRETPKAPGIDPACARWVP